MRWRPTTGFISPNHGSWVGAAVFLFGTRGMYPLLPIFRRLGIRRAREIERKRYAVKALRGDFDAMSREPSPGPEGSFKKVRYQPGCSLSRPPAHGGS